MCVGIGRVIEPPVSFGYLRLSWWAWDSWMYPIRGSFASLKTKFERNIKPLSAYALVMDFLGSNPVCICHLKWPQFHHL